MDEIASLSFDNSFAMNRARKVAKVAIYIVYECFVAIGLFCALSHALRLLHLLHAA